MQVVEMLDQVPGGNGDEAWGQAALGDKCGGRVLGQFANDPAGGDILGQIQIMGASGLGGAGDDGGQV